jgi:spore maturation protein CgeB
LAPYWDGADSGVSRGKILYGGPIDPGSTARHRMLALERIGYEVVPFNFADYLRGTGRIANWLYHRLLTGPAVDRLDRDFQRLAETSRPNLIMVDKPIFLRPETVQSLSKTIAPIIQYNLDNPFGRMGEPGWRKLIAAIPLYDLHFVPREINIADYRRAGARQVIRLPLAYEPTVHFPPPADWGEDRRTIDVSFTGSPYDDRAEFLTRLLTEHGIATDIRGDRWQRVLPPKIAAQLYRGPSLQDGAYRQRFWDSKICLSFVTHANNDQVAHKSFEIAASGGFLLAEATEEHREMFEDGKEAVFFTGLADCARLIREYLPQPELRRRIAEAGWRRALVAGYSNNARMGQAFESVRKMLKAP